MSTRVQLMQNNVDIYKYWVMHRAIGLFIDDIRGEIGMLIGLMAHNELQEIVTETILIDLRAILAHNYGTVRIFGRSDFMRQYYEAYEDHGGIVVLDKKYFLIHEHMFAQTYDVEQILQYLAKNGAIIVVSIIESNMACECEIHL